MTSVNQDVTCTRFRSSEEFLARWENGLSVDLIFLDIQFPGELNGMSLAKRVRQRDQTVFIVFVTNYADYVYEGYIVNALRYLKKPVRTEDIFSCMDIAYRRFSLLQQKKLSIVCRDQRLALPFSEILYVEMQSHYVRLTISDSEEKPEVRTRLRDFATQLPPQLFIQCHRSYIVNLEHIRRFTRESLTMSNQEIVPISQTFAPTLRKRYDWYYLGK
jgi:two-component system response regulator LytT